MSDSYGMADDTSMDWEPASHTNISSGLASSDSIGTSSPQGNESNQTTESSHEQARNIPQITNQNPVHGRPINAVSGFSDGMQQGDMAVTQDHNSSFNRQQFEAPNRDVAFPNHDSVRGRLLTQQQTWTNSVRGMTPPPGEMIRPLLSVTSGGSTSSSQEVEELYTQWPSFAYSLLAEEKRASQTHMDARPSNEPENGLTVQESRKRTMNFDNEQGGRSVNFSSRPKAQLKRVKSSFTNVVSSTKIDIQAAPVTVDAYSLFWSDSIHPDQILQNPSHDRGELRYSCLEHNDSFRILCIEPGEGKLICKILHSRLQSSSQQYEALSYHWGDSNTSSMIEIGNGSLSITKNLQSALLHLRYKDKPRYIWIDALCINQNDLDERSRQVALMHQIYTRASNVVIWLGPDPNQNAKMAFSVISSIASGGELDGRPVGQANFYSNGVSSVNIPDLPCRDGPPKASFKALWSKVQELFDHGWFWRLWCLQEAVLARTAHIYWGTCHIAWPTLGLAAARLRIGKLPILRLYPMPGVFNAYFMYRISVSQPFQSISSLPPLRLTFPKLLALAAQFGATDPRDRVFGLLGIPTIDAAPERGQLFLTPDYSKTVLEVYLDLLQQALKHDRSNQDGQNLALFLSSVQHTDSDKLEQMWEAQEWPSWIPEWGTNQTQLFLPSALDLATHRGLVEIFYSPRPALHIQTIFYTTIDSVMPISSLDLTTMDASSASAGTRMVLAHTLTGGKSWYGNTADHDEHHLDFDAYIQHAKDGGNNDSDMRARRFAQAVQNVAPDRVLLQIGHETRMGLGPAAVKAGDLIAILDGTGATFVLRLCPSSTGEREFVLVGECYVYNLGRTVAQDWEASERIRLV